MSKKFLFAVFAAALAVGAFAPSAIAAEADDPAEQYKLGCNYYRGVGVPRDYTRAVHWFRKAREQGYKMGGIIKDDKGNVQHIEVDY